MDKDHGIALENHYPRAYARAVHAMSKEKVFYSFHPRPDGLGIPA